MDVDIDNLPTKVTQAEIRKAATSEKTIEKLKNIQGGILQQSMIEIIGEDIRRKPLVDQWYRKPNGAKDHKDTSAILLGEPEQPDRWEQIAQELQNLIRDNKTKEFLQMANRVTQIKSQA